MSVPWDPIINWLGKSVLSVTWLAIWDSLRNKKDSGWFGIIKNKKRKKTKNSFSFIVLGQGCVSAHSFENFSVVVVCLARQLPQRVVDLWHNVVDLGHRVVHLWFKRSHVSYSVNQNTVSYHVTVGWMNNLSWACPWHVQHITRPWPWQILHLQ